MHATRRRRAWIAAASLALPTTTLRAADQVKVTGGLVEGVRGTDPSIRLFEGLPYAAPPVGPLRWKAPQPVPPWTGVRKAEWGPRCVQGLVWDIPLVSREKRMDEDCLYLNVWTGAKTDKERRPVLFVIHGGGFAQGTGAEPRTDGEWFARQGLVVVEPNYRLGVLGFLAHPELSRESDGKGSGNYGLLDQAMALRWVQDNVAAFGGDPGNVTINGESAGSMSVGALMASPLTKALFHKAIGQSGAYFPSPTGEMRAKPLADKEQDGLKFAAAVGAASLAELRAKPAAELLAAQMKGNRLAYSPGVDGHLLTEPVAATYAAGRQAHVPLLAGWTSSELSMVIALNPQQPTAAGFAAELDKRFGDAAPAARKAYAAATDAEAGQAAADLAGDMFIAYSTWKWIEVHARMGAAPVYRYRFDRALPEPNGANRFGAIHATDLEYAFNTLDSKPAAWQAEDRRAAEAMARAFANFAKTGSPNGPGVPDWPEFGKSGQVMYLDGTSQARPEQGRARYELIDSLVGR